MKPINGAKMKFTTLILKTNASSCTFTLDVDLRYTSKAFPALSRIQRALDKFLTNNSHWLAEDEPRIVALVQSDTKLIVKYASGLSLTKIDPLIV
jgi:hypothetical protein